MRTHRRSRSRQPLMIDPAALAALRGGEGRQRIFADLYERCLAWARRSGRLLSQIDRREIVAEALAEALPVILRHDADAAAVDRAIRTSLRRSKSSLLRALAEPAGPDDGPADLEHDFHQTTAKIEMEHLIEVTRAAGGFISIALDLLCDRDHDLLITGYKLTEAGLRLRGARPPAFPDAEALAAATRLALRRFSHNLEAVYVAGRSALAMDPALLDEALRLVRGEAVSALGLIQALPGRT